MQEEIENLEPAAIRCEMMALLRQQLEALDSREGLTDARLMECYQRQHRVQALRERLQSATQNDAPQNGALHNDTFQNDEPRNDPLHTEMPGGVLVESRMAPQSPSA